MVQAEQRLLLSDQLRYVPRLAGDELHDGSLRWKIDRKLKAPVCELIARHRLKLPEDRLDDEAALCHAYAVKPFSWWFEWLGTYCQSDEVLLASLPTGETQQIESAYDGGESADVYWVWTSCRVFLAYAGRLGDVGCKAMTLPVTFQRGVLSGALVRETLRYEVSGKYAKSIEAMQGLANQDPWLWKASVVALVLGTQGVSQASALADTRAYRDDEALGLVYPLWRAPNASEPVARELQSSSLLVELWSVFHEHAKVQVQPPSNIEIAELDEWLAQLSCTSLMQDLCFERPWPLGRMLARLCLAWQARAGERSEQSAPKHQGYVALLQAVFKSFEPVKNLAQIESSLAHSCVFALLCQTCAAPREAHACYAQLMEVLPKAHDLELVLGQEDAHAPLRHLLDALVHQALQLWPEGSPERTSLLETAASLVPLELPRLRAWFEASEPGSEQRAGIEETLVQLGTLDRPHESSLPDAPAHPLRSTDLESKLIHPAARASTRGSLQAMLAKLERPDHSSLKKYCDPGQEGVLAKEIDRVASLFEKDGVDVFISHGDRRYGVQAFEGEPAFLLVGGEHRRPESPALLELNELRFTLGAELAHLYLGHARVSSQDVLRGAFDKGKLTFELVTSLVPFLSAFPWGRRLGQLAGYFDNKLVARSAQRVRDYFGSSDGPASAEFTLDRSVGLIAAHRMMQLTADRAGLLCSGDLGACIVAMWKIRPESIEHLDLLRRQGVTAAIKIMSQHEDDLWRGLATRAAALTAFAWSAEYQELKSWCWGKSV